MRTSRFKPVPAIAFVAAILLGLVIAPTATAEPSYEPNDTLDTAYGPLVAGTTYSGTIADVWDDDNYYFYVTDPDGSQVSVTVNDTTVGGDGVYFELDDSEGSSIDNADVNGEDSATLQDKLDPGKYYVSVSAELDDETNENYSLSIAAEPGTLGSYTDVQLNCKSAKSAVSTAQAALDQAERRLKRTRKSSSKRRKAQARRAIKAAKDKLNAANAAMKATCSIPARP